MKTSQYAELLSKLDEAARIERAENGQVSAVNSLFVSCQYAIRDLENQLEELSGRLKEALEVETIAAMMTHFTGQYPYVGWKGVALAIAEALNDKNIFHASLQEIQELKGEQATIEMARCIANTAFKIIPKTRRPH